MSTIGTKCSRPKNLILAAHGPFQELHTTNCPDCCIHHVYHNLATKSITTDLPGLTVPAQGTALVGQLDHATRSIRHSPPPHLEVHRKLLLCHNTAYRILYCTIGPNLQASNLVGDWKVYTSHKWMLVFVP